MEVNFVKVAESNAKIEVFEPSNLGKDNLETIQVSLLRLIILCVYIFFIVKGIYKIQLVIKLSSKLENIIIYYSYHGLINKTIGINISFEIIKSEYYPLQVDKGFQTKKFPTK